MHALLSNWKPGIDDEVVVPIYSDNCKCSKPLLDCICQEVWYSGSILGKCRKKGTHHIYKVYIPDLDEDFQIQFDPRTWLSSDYSVV
jgi:hypothetical protein